MTGAPLLDVTGLTLRGAYTDVRLQVRAGEVVGLAGATASGNVRLAETLAGLHRADAGRISVAGREVRVPGVPAALAAGVGLVPEDRHHQGLVGTRSVAENATLTVTGQLGPYGTVLPGPDPCVRRAHDQGPGHQDAGRRDPRHRPVRRQPAEGGGGPRPGHRPPRAGRGASHQRGGRALEGVFAGQDRRVADDGRAALVVSDELDDLRACDRIVAMFHGRVVAEFGRGWRDEELVAAMEGVAARPPARERDAEQGEEEEGSHVHHH